MTVLIVNSLKMPFIFHLFCYIKITKKPWSLLENVKLHLGHLQKWNVGNESNRLLYEKLLPVLFNCSFGRNIFFFFFTWKKLEKFCNGNSKRRNMFSLPNISFHANDLYVWEKKWLIKLKQCHPDYFWHAYFASLKICSLNYLQVKCYKYFLTTVIQFIHIYFL